MVRKKAKIKVRKTRMKSSTEGKLPYDAFILKAIKQLRKPPYKGIHVVFSGFNAAFLEYYGIEARPFVDDMAKRGVVVVHPTRGGATITPSEDATDIRQTTSDVLTKILKK